MCDAVLSRGSPRQGEGSPLCGSVTLPADVIYTYTVYEGTPIMCIISLLSLFYLEPKITIIVCLRAIYKLYICEILCLQTLEPGQEKLRTILGANKKPKGEHR